MAVRIAFTWDSRPTFSHESVLELPINFEWVAGQHISRVQQSIRNLHKSIRGLDKSFNPLEISTKSEVEVGRLASAMNLSIKRQDWGFCYLESLYQSSKVFEDGGPYRDLETADPKSAKSDERLKKSGALIGFDLDGEIWPLGTFPTFYDWLYIKSLVAVENSHLIDELKSFNVYTDINYSQTSLDKKHGRSFNCQAKSLALLMSAPKEMNIDTVLQHVRESAMKANLDTLF